MWIFFVALVSLFLASPAWSAVYYVDKFHVASVSCDNQNPGTQAQPRCDVTAGMTLLGSGDTLYVRGGNYGETVTVRGGQNNVASGTDWDHPTIIAGFPGETVTLHGFGFYHVFPYNIGSVKYVIVKNFVMDGGGIGSLGCGHPANPDCGAHFIRWQDIETKNNSQSGGGCGYGATDIHFYNVHAHHNGSSRLDHGMYVDCPRIIIDGYHAHDNSGYGLQFSDSDPGCYPNCGPDSIFRNSYVHDNQVTGGGVGDGQVTFSSANHLQIYNNVIVASNNTALALNSGTDHSKVWNNTIYMTGNGSGIDVGHPTDYDLTDITFQNNIIYGNTNPATVWSPRFSGGTFQNNMCQVTNIMCTIAQNPLFTDPGARDFTLLSGSPAIDAGLDLSANFTTDKNGAARGQGPTGAWDLGAYEFNQGGVVPPPPTGLPIYVAASGGTPTTDCITAENPATPIRTITTAMNCMVVPGKIMYIKAGTYTDCIDTGAKPITGGLGPSYTDATIIASYSTDLVTIQPTSCPATGVGVFFRNGSSDKYIVFRGSSTNRLVLDGTNMPNNLAIYPNAHHLRFEYVDVKNSTDFEGFYGLNTSNIELVDSRVHGAVTAGIAFDGTSADWLIERTEVYSNGGVGINHQSGTASGVTIKESTIKDNTGNGITIGAATGTTLVNSLVYDNGGIGLRLMTGSSVTKIYNSTFYSNTGNGIQCDSGAVTAEVRNTISFGNATNILNNCTLTTQTNLETNPLFVDPPTNLQLQETSPAVNTGTTLASVTIDRAGTTRPVGSSYDIGAYDRDGPAPSPPPGLIAHLVRLALMLF